VSVTLSQDDLRAVTTACASKSFTSDRLWLNGVEQDVTTSNRFKACIEGVRRLASDRTDSKTGEIIVRKEDWNKYNVHLVSENNFPTAAGLASSAAGYAALVASLAALFCAVETFEGELSTIARQGSGSACRSMYGGFVAWRKGGGKEDASDSKAEQICDENHWPQLRAVILVVSDKKKETSSTDGMNTSVRTSKLLAYRAECVVEERMAAIEAAFKERNFSEFGLITMADSNQFHATCLDTYPPIFYLNDTSREIINLVHKYNSAKGEVCAAYTFDAGPNAVIYTTERDVVEVTAIVTRKYFDGAADLDYINDKVVAEEAGAVELDDVYLDLVGSGSVGSVGSVFVTKMGGGPRVLELADSLVDSATGLMR
jgi:diphosphomevalonate decarboxylase